MVFECSNVVEGNSDVPWLLLLEWVGAVCVSVLVLFSDLSEGRWVVLCVAVLIVVPVVVLCVRVFVSCLVVLSDKVVPSDVDISIVVVLLWLLLVVAVPGLSYNVVVDFPVELAVVVTCVAVLLTVVFESCSVANLGEVLVG